MIPTNLSTSNPFIAHWVSAALVVDAMFMALFKKKYIYIFITIIQSEIKQRKACF